MKFHFYYTLNFHVLFLLALNTRESLKGFKKPGRKEQVSSLHTWNSSVTIACIKPSWAGIAISSFHV